MKSTPIEKEIAELNKKQEKLTRKKEKESIRAYNKERRAMIVEGIRKNISSAANTIITPIAQVIEDTKQQMEAKKQESLRLKNIEQERIQTYNSFLELIQKTKHNIGVETEETQFGIAEIIYTKDFGPIITIPNKLPDGLSKTQNDDAFHYEGFAPDEDGIFAYYNVDLVIAGNKSRTEKITAPNYTPGTVSIKGYTIDPHNHRVSGISKKDYIHYIRPNSIIAHLESQKQQALEDMHSENLPENQ